MLAGYILDFRYINNCQFYICNTTPQNDPLIKQKNAVKLVFKRSPLGHRKYNPIRHFNVYLRSFIADCQIRSIIIHILLLAEGNLLYKFAVAL
jgi:hypothetical protein